MASNIDQKTEAQIQAIFKNLAKGKTTFIIAHRLSTVKDADILLVMQNGMIVERGNHAELMKKKAFYFRLYNQTSKIELPDHGNLKPMKKS